MSTAHAPSPRGLTAAAGAFLSILGFADKLQPGAARALRAELLSDVSLDGVDARGPAERLPTLLEAAAKLTRTDDFGLLLAEASDLKRLGLVNYIGASSSSLRDAYERAARYLGLWNEGAEIGLEDDGPRVSITWRPRGPSARASAPGRCLQEQLAIGTLLSASLAFSGRRLVPEHVEFVSKRPASTAHQERVLAAPLAWGGAVARIVVQAQVLEVPLPQHDSNLQGILTRHADELLSRFGAAPLWASRVQRELMTLLRSGTADIDQVAKSLALSRRTLQRRLDAEGVTFEELLDQVRYELTTRLLATPQHSIADVAWLVGYQELSAFYRAFRRWCGDTPAEYRRRLVPDAAH
jgi:AraC-like DNA-binding protein